MMHFNYLPKHVKLIMIQYILSMLKVTESTLI